MNHMLWPIVTRSQPNQTTTDKSDLQVDIEITVAAPQSQQLLFSSVLTDRYFHLFCSVI